MTDNQSGPGGLATAQVIEALRKARTSLVRAYMLHVLWFTVMCGFVGLHWNQGGLKASVLLTLVTVPPVLVFTVKVHRLCRAIDPRSRTVGLVSVIVTTLVLSPFESGLLLPAKNLIVANRLLRAHRPAQALVDNDPAGLPDSPGRENFQ